jgi:aspartyl-tRNA(Asn)/glutamyl-tRNA(Gln) amidotransferase subunit C
MKSKKSSLTKSECERIARLAGLTLTDEEVNTFTPQLSSVLNYFNKLSELDTKTIEPTFSTSKEANRFQQQAIGSDTLDQSDVLKNAPDTKDGYVRTKAVFE